MADTLSRERRSETMRRIRGKNTQPEVILRKALWKAGVRGWRLHRLDLPGKPDLVFPGRKLAVFVDGCFWHGCPTCYRRPRSSQSYWDVKLEKNVSRDRANEELLVQMGYCPVRFWEHEVKRDVANCVAVIQQALARSSM